MSALAPCPSCARHVRRDERACPFCASVLSLPALIEGRSPTERLGRAALFTFGAVLATSASACVGVGNPVPLYGAAPPHDAAVNDASSAVDAGTDGGGGTLYGGPPQDAAVDIDTGGASSDYGAPPPP
jgi:hypothetical protein